MQKVKCRMKNSAFSIPPSALEWSPWSDLHRRIRVYETRPVAAEAQGPTKCRRRNGECRILHCAFILLHLNVVLSRGFAPRTSAFAERRAETNYTLRAKRDA